MKLEIIKGIDSNLLKIETNEAKIIVGLGEEKGAGQGFIQNDPMIEGLTCGKPLYDGIFILRNPENCDILNSVLNEIPIYVLPRQKSFYYTYMDFNSSQKRENIKELLDTESCKLKDLEISSFIIDPSNQNTSIIKFKDSLGKTLVVCGDFRNYDGVYGQDRFKKAITMIQSADTVIIDGKYLGKNGAEFLSGKDLFEKLKNIMKFYKQVFVIQSETDLNMTNNLYQVAIKTGKLFVESTCTSNLSVIANGSCPTPFNNKKVFSFNPLVLENREFDFKRKYVVPFSMRSASNIIKRKKFVMNITKEFFQDIQLLKKQGTLYDACLILAEWKGNIDKDPELENFVTTLKEYGMDYYELYTYGKVNMNTIFEIINKLNAKNVITLNLDLEEREKVRNQINNFKLLEENEVFEI